ncbi:hypothetical protein [Pannonibacter phragmitetus]|uniref:hypothetical protein n=1 Tax=Pannonibacter phragmitetus TaxID=121719 RepID=UPI003D2EF521
MSGITAERGRLLNEAIDLVIRLQNDPANPVALEMIRAWRARGRITRRFGLRLQGSMAHPA